MRSRIAAFADVVVMPEVLRLARRLASPQPGQSMVEYAIVAAVIAIAALGAVQALGIGIAGVFQRLLHTIAGVG